ncbi:putative DNA-directed RNA polymerase I and III subunit RPAC1 [Histomonas meleagridis]|uniref:putative DNA-directed RNA polymerase I and III subunit RPAC1 n=1 Tax=Histomonas meleagridis TaxID=135588 RepID=UPI00355A22A3|nr:putative DNA-directed RNA polymerase I and III subunit RPAC1 [Histomonas meleagridis]KAH0797705.1 putative DNA-directed RNA polymerase I and III subunit RPAC1 [Histomonas meleagridis]
MSFGYVFNEDTCAKQYDDEIKYDPIPESYVEILSYEKLEPTGEDRLVFDLVNAPPSHANALRRTLISRVPSVSLEVIGITVNDGIMPDEILCHRLGLIPLDIDPKYIDFPNGPIPNDSNDPNTTFLFGLNIIGGEGPEPDYTGIDSTWEDDKERFQPMYTGPSGLVKSEHLVWMPFPGQAEQFPSIHPLHLDIPITKLKPGQHIELTARAVKSFGLDHAKFSPVCTAFYRMVPLIEVNNSRLNDTTKQILVKKCPMGVFDIEDGDVVVRNPRKCTSCRECLRELRVKNYIKVGKEANRYEFTVESVGVRPAYELVKEAFEILKERCNLFSQLIRDADPMKDQN